MNYNKVISEVQRNPMKLANKNPKDKKLQQFLDDLNDLLERYQYMLNPRAQYLSTGVELNIAVENSTPAKAKPVTKRSKKNG